MGNKSAEVPRQTVESNEQLIRPRRGSPLFDKLIVNSSKIVGEGVWFYGKNLAKGTAGTIKLLWNKKRDVGMAAGGAVAAVTVMNPSQSADMTKQIVREGVYQTARVLDIKDKMPSQVEFEKLTSKPTNFDLAFPGLYDSEKLEAISQVQNARESLDEYNGPEMAANVAQYDELIRKSAKENDISADILFGIVGLESKGDKFAVSSAGAKGLTQMGDLVARKHNLRLSDGEDDDRFDPEKIIPATANELAQLSEKEGTIAGAIQEWHMGEDHYQGFKRSFLARMGVVLPDINVQPENDSPEALQRAYEEASFRINLYKLTTIQRGVSPFKIFKDPKIHEIVQDSAWNDTENYIPYVLAAIDKYYQEKPK